MNLAESFLDQVKRQGEEGPYTQEVQAAIYMKQDKKLEALEILENIIYTSDLTGYPVQ